MALTQSQIEKKLSNENLDELLELWQTEQGAAKRRDLQLMAAALPFPVDARLRVLDLCCGPGDADGFAEWRSRQASRYSRENWERFWTRANEILGYDHTKLLGSRDSHLDEGMPVSGWFQALRNAGFECIDVLLRDADEVILATAKPGRTRSADATCNSYL
jgi:hypothetical protein